MTDLLLRWCAECRTDQLFEVPPCDDGHGHDCPDLACTDCGSAAVLGIAERPDDAAGARVARRSA